MGDCLYVDGSFLGHSLMMGFGVVHVDSHGKIIKIHSLACQLPPQFKPHGSLAAEIGAAIVGLRLVETPSVLEKLYTDCQLLYRQRWKNKKDFPDYMIEWLNALHDECGRFEELHIKAPPKNSPDLPHYLPALAHNASARASGSRKKECTYPYIGEFSHRRNSEPTAVIRPRHTGSGMEVVDTTGYEKEDYPIFDPRHTHFTF
jgi:hypothetical protein